MSSPDGAPGAPWWNSQSQRWEWGVQPGPAAGPEADAPAAAEPSTLPAAPPPGYGFWPAPPSSTLQPPSPLPPSPPLPPPPPPPLPPYGPDGGSGGSGGGSGGGAGQWRTPLLVGLVAAVAGGSAVAAWMLLGGKGEQSAAPGPPAASAPSQERTEPTGPRSSPPGASTGASASATPSGSPSPGAGYTVVRNESGFSVAVPTGWQPSHDETGSGSFYRPPGDRSALLQIFRVTEDSAAGSCELLRMSSQRLDDGTPAYRQVSLEPVAGDACELVYEYDSAESHGRRRGMERIVTTPDGKRWALLAAGPATDSPTVRAHLTAALDSFRPG
ncbi:hypothetical protein Slala03_01840 [Streptomyces lavendulae subsp. lavendulae]|uniref:hypothetical protein n=1 Tax=Streptomyces lavendulae TaxID=1914 RepID=UPI0024A177B3|nr:hypothetical protein [Streptomyces lavendulae]GLV80495.1 hypothetical protein Slala03_01840 [Streptomyces lavendulae subsp. lavendulae]